MNTLLLIFLAPFLTSTAVGQVESVQTQAPFLQTAALKFYCRYGSLLNEDVSGCNPKTVVQEELKQTVQEKVVEVVRNVFVPVASAQEPSDSYLESMIRRIVLELLPQPQVITVKGEKGDKGDKGDPGVSGSNLQAFDGIQMPFWNGYGAGPVTGGGTTVINNVTNVFGSSSTSSMTADNGLTINPANNVQLGGTLIQDTNIDLATRTLTLNQTSTSSRFKIQGASGYGSGFSTQDLVQIETYPNEGFAISSFETGPLVTDSHGTFLNFSSNLANPLFDPLGAYIYSDRTTGAIGMGRFAGGSVFLDASGLDLVSEDAITSVAGSVQGFFANDNNLLVPGDAGFRFRTSNASSNDIAVANFDPGVGLGVNMFVGQFDPNTQFTGDPGDFYFNMSPVDDDDVLWVKGPSGGFGTSVGWVPVQAGTSSPTTAWLINGNGGTDPNVNFVGTTDGQDLVLRTNNIEVARFGLANNFSFGYGAQALSSNMNVMGNDAGVGANNAQSSNFFGLNAGGSAINASMSNFIGFYAGSNATNAGASNFIGASAGNGATNAATSNFIGDSAGFNATDATFSNFIGYRAGFVSPNASNSNFIGNEAGNGATDASNANFFGQMAGLGALNAQASNFIGFRSGLNATNAYRSNFFGYFAGQDATNANNSNFFGESAGQDATNANNSNFFGTSAGQSATDASDANFFGQNAGNGASSAVGSNFFGANAGNGATNASFSNFFGAVSGLAATAASNSNFFGTAAGANATNASNSNFFGANAGENGTNAFNSSFFGTNAGYQATNASNSNFFGTDTGSNAIDAYASNFFGINAGNGATNANSSNFYGANAGYQAVNAFGSNFFGPDAGSSATNASRSNFFGDSAGQNSVNASYSNFLGYRAGENAPNAANSIFIGQRAGFNDVVNNTVSGTSILIGDDTSTGGFSNSIVLGANATNTASNQLYIRDAITNFNLAGVNYNFPTTQGATGTVLTNNGTGGLTWLTPATTSISSSTIAANFGFIQNGNSFGTSATLGTNDNFGLTFETVNTPRITINQTGSVNVAGETLGAGTYTMNVGAGASSHALRITGVSDTIYAQQGAGANVFFIRTAGTNTFLNASAGNTLAFGVGGTTQNDLQIDPNGDTSVRRRFFVSDSFAGSGTARVGATVASAVASVSDQTGNTTQLLIQPNDGGLNSTATNIGLNVNMGGLSGGTNYAAIFQNGNVGIGTAAPSESLQVVGNILANAIMPNGPYGSNVSNYDLGSTTARWREVWTNIVNVGGASTWSLVNNATRLDFSAGASGSGAERVTFLTGGEVGIGNTTPTDRLHVGNASGPSVRISVDSATQAGVVFKEGGTARWSLIHGDLGNGVFGLLNHFNSSYALSVSSTSNIGLSNNNPLFILHTGSSSIVSGTTVARFENAGGTCDVTPNVAGGITCTSDQNLKKDIESIDPIDTLTRLLTVEVKSYRMNADTSTSTKQTGFLAQQLETQFPGLVLTSIEGTKSVSYAGMTPILTQAIQTLYKFMTDIGVTIEGGVAKIGNFFAKKVTTEELCVGNVCVTESQFLQMVQSTQAASNVVNTELSGENSSDNETINNTPEVSGSNLSEDQINEEGTNQLSGTPLNVETNLSNIEPVVETMSDAVVSTDSIE